MIPRILITNIVNGVPIKKFGDGSATRTWTYISDLVGAFLCALRHPLGFAEFNMGAPNSMTLNGMITCAEKVTGRKAIIDQRPVPPGDAHTVGHPNCDLIKKTLGWVPKIGVEEGMRLTYLDYMRQRKRNAAVQDEKYVQKRQKTTHSPVSSDSESDPMGLPVSSSESDLSSMCSH